MIGLQEAALFLSVDAVPPVAVPPLVPPLAPEDDVGCTPNAPAEGVWLTPPEKEAEEVRTEPTAGDAPKFVDFVEGLDFRWKTLCLKESISLFLFLCVSLCLALRLSFFFRFSFVCLLLFVSCCCLCLLCLLCVRGSWESGSEFYPACPFPSLLSQKSAFLVLDFSLLSFSAWTKDAPRGKSSGNRLGPV